MYTGQTWGKALLKVLGYIPISKYLQKFKNEYDSIQQLYSVQVQVINMVLKYISLVLKYYFKHSNLL